MGCGWSFSHIAPLFSDVREALAHHLKHLLTWQTVFKLLPHPKDMLRQWLSLGCDNKDHLALIKPNNPSSDRQVGSDMPQRDTDNAIEDCPCLRYLSLYSSRWDDWINYVTGNSFAFYVMTVLTQRCSSLLSPSKVIRIPRQESERQGEWNRFTKLWWETLVMKEAFKVQKDSPFLFFCFRSRCYSRICQTHTAGVALSLWAMNSNWCWIRFHVQRCILCCFL